MKISKRPITSAYDFNDKPFVVQTIFHENDDLPYDYDYEEIIYAMNARTARAIADSLYKNDNYEIVDIHLASPEDQARLSDKTRW